LPKHFIRKVVAWLSVHDDVIKPLLTGVPRPSLALDLASARAALACISGADYTKVPSEMNILTSRFR